MVSRRFRREIKPGSVWVIVTAIIGVGFALVFIHQLNTRLHPILLELALSQTSNHLTAAIDQTVAVQAVSYNDLVTLERSQGGDIVALTSNMAQANALRADLLATGLSALDSLESMEMDIPLGTIFDWDLLSGLGPDVNIKVLYYSQQYFLHRCLNF